MAAGEGKLCSLVALLVALLAMFITAPASAAAADAARPHLTMQSLSRGTAELMGAFGMSGGGHQPCCLCACTRMWPPERNMCACGGFWEGSCPSVCKDCSCDDDSKCVCRDGFTIKYNDCAANECARTADRKEMM